MSLKKLTVYLFTLLAVLSAYNSYAMSSKPVITKRAEVKLVSSGYEKDGRLNLGLYYKLAPGWHIYWKNPGDTGFPPSVTFNGSENIKSSELLWPAPVRDVQEIMNNIYTESYVYKDEVLFPIIVTTENPKKNAAVKLQVDYAICAELCIPEQASFELEIPPAYNSTEMVELIDKYKSQVPAANGNNGINITDVTLSKEGDEEALHITVNGEKSLKNAGIFIDAGIDFAFYSPEKILENNNLSATFNAPVRVLGNKNSIYGEDIQMVVVSDGKSVEYNINGRNIKPGKKKITNADQYSFLIILLFGFIGGFILNVMPCVFPVLSIKLLGIIKYGGGSKRSVAASFIVTALGIIASFIGLALFIIALRAAGMHVGWGFHFQEPLFIITLVVILTLFAANLWGLYEIRLPVGVGALAYKKTEKHNLLGHFMTGVLATTLATPCTAPFLGTAVGFAVAGSDIEIIATFAAMGLGMALPYLIFSLFPGMVIKLPKPGEWMVRVKFILGLFLIVTAVWLIWVLSHQLGVAASYMLLLICIAKIIKLWAGKHVEFLANPRTKFLMIAFLVVIAFVLPLQVAEKSDPYRESDVIFSKGDIWEPFKRNDIELLVENGKIVFVDVTADWCLTCKVNKLLVLENRQVREEFLKHDVVAMRADWTNEDDKIADYLASHKRLGIPFNIVYGPNAPEGIILSELLSVGEVLRAIKHAGGN